jgi:hypothetical protein
LIGHLQSVFGSCQDLLPRGSSIAIGAFQFIDLRLEARLGPTFGSTTIPFGRRTTKSIWRIAGGGNFIPAESSRTQRNSWRFYHARSREDLDASSSSGNF